MKIIITILFVALFLANEILPQVVTGKLVDENNIGLAQVDLQLFTATNIYYAISGSDGTFSFNIITGIEDNQLPIGYSVSNNFPNPFNPITRIGITLPSKENVKVEVFNLLGQSVKDVIEHTFDAGTNNIDIELNGLPNGFYISRITIGDKYTVVKKLMLIYGSQHLVISGSTITSQLNKSNNTHVDTTLDSLVATSSIIGIKTFTGLPSFVSGTLNLGSLTIIRYCPGNPTVLYAGKSYNTVIIGTQCWLRENLDVGTMINSADTMKNNGILEKYCYDNNTTNCTTYGGLFQWNEAMQYVTNEGAQGICPSGWHIPKLSEFETLRLAVNNYGLGNALKEIGQGSGNGAGTNKSGFSVLLAGHRDIFGSFNNLANSTEIWSSRVAAASEVYTMYLNNSSGADDLDFSVITNGYSVRCIKD